MKEITLIIDGKECKGVQGDTILDIANKNDVYIPTLCYQKGLTPIGACRMCVVQLEGNPKMLPSCTTPAQDGMVVITQNDVLKDYRRQVLELLFAGRNHFCMYCSQSGDCELQALAIEHEMDSVRFPYLYYDFEVDATNPELMMDHNRCILCQRCIRTCSEIVGAHTLDLEHRGWQAKVVPDLGRKLRESDTCVNCGACAQSCPTGTITIREFAYRGRRSECDAIVDSVCPLCAVGCKIKAYVRTGSIVRVEGTGLEEPDGGQLCYMGRWWLPESTERERVTVPLIREGASYREATWEEALTLASTEFKKAYDREKAGAILSSLCTDEELTLFSSLFRNALKMKHTDTFDGDVIRGFFKGFMPFKEQGVRPFTAAHNILDSDLIVTMFADPQKEAPVVASYIRVACLHKNAKLINLSHGTSPFPGLTDLDVQFPQGQAMPKALSNLAETISKINAGPSEMAGFGEYEIGAENVLSSYRDSIEESAKAMGLDLKIVEETAMMLLSARKPIFVLGSRATKSHELITAACNLAVASRAFYEDGLGVVPLLVSANSLGARNTVVSEEPWVGREKRDFMYVFSTAMVPEEEEILAAISATKFVVVQTPFKVRPLVNLADIILPAPAWYERSGHYCTIEGERRKLNTIVPPKEDVKTLHYAMEEFAKKLGVKLERPEISAYEEAFKSQLRANEARIVSL
ncbi:MAG TPA: 2Fe-2S iron-sulfur cluster-binding protein [Acetomicrobium sp.]|nr:2Fe-2S iron-sulfur cluster-binding protein [Acetomicrobium sp.]